MTGNKAILSNFVEKYGGVVRFGNDHFAAIMGYGELIQADLTIKRVAYVEGLGHNLFSIGQFCDKELEVNFRSTRCSVRTYEGKELLVGSRRTNLYSINLNNLRISQEVCLMSKASGQQSWLWHRRLSHLNFKNIN